MKKIMQLLLCGITVLLITGNAFAISRNQMEAMTLKDVACAFTNPHDLEIYLSTVYLYKSDLENYGKDDYWATPQEFMKKRAGDCEDFAIFEKYILEYNRYHCWIIAYGQKGNVSHAILIYQLRPELPFGVMSNQFDYGYFGHDFDNIVKKFSRDVKAWSVLFTDENGHYYGSEDHHY